MSEGQGNPVRLEEAGSLHSPYTSRWLKYPNRHPGCFEASSLLPLPVGRGATQWEFQDKTFRILPPLKAKLQSLKQQNLFLYGSSGNPNPFVGLSGSK